MATTTVPPRTAASAFPLKYFVLAFAFTWFFWGLAVLGARGVIPLLPGFMVIGTFGPLVAAVVITAQESGQAEVRSLLGRVVLWRVSPIWYIVVILGPILLYLAAMALNVALGGQPPDLSALVGALPIVLAISVYMLIFVTLGEEVGWRGYALPALQTRYGALLASVILGVMWALWHLPQFFNPDTIYSNFPFVLQLALQVPLAILITWVYNSTRGSVLMVMLLHAMFNASGQLWKTIPEYSVRPPSAAEAAARTVHVNLMLTIVLWVAAIVVVCGSTNLSRKPRQVSADAAGESQPRVR
jgi:membrane protease YdiL (CAAX protease family)